MKKDERQRFQGLCLVQQEGYKFMFEFDAMNHDTRELLRYSPYNLCAACVMTTAHSISIMENMVRQSIPKECRPLEPKGKNRLLKSRLRRTKKLPGRG